MDCKQEEGAIKTQQKEKSWLGGRSELHRQLKNKRIKTQQKHRLAKRTVANTTSLIKTN